MNELYRTATRLLGDPGKASDAVQETYLQAWKSFDKFEPGTNCRAWLYQILFHVVQHYRRKWMNTRMIADSEELFQRLEAGPAPIPQQITDAEVLSALDGLPEEYRAVVLLVDVEEFSYKEAADILKVPMGTVMSRLSRGRRLLREVLAGLAQSYGIGRSVQEGQPA